MFSQNTIEIQSKLKFSVKAKAKYNRNRNSEGYPTLLISNYFEFTLLSKVKFMIRLKMIKFNLLFEHKIIFIYYKINFKFLYIYLFIYYLF